MVIIIKLSTCNIRHLLITLILFSFLICQSDQITLKKNEFKRHNLSIGMFDDKTGISMISYTYNKQMNEMNEYFIGVGSMLFAFTGSIGWKHYLYKNSKNSIYSVLSQQIVTHIGFTGYMPTVSLTLEHKLKWFKIKTGFIALFIFRIDEDKEEFGVLPFLSLNFDF